MPEYLLILRRHLTKPQEDSYEQDQEQPAKLVGGCHPVLVETPRIVFRSSLFKNFINNLERDFKSKILDYSSNRKVN